MSGWSSPVSFVWFLEKIVVYSVRVSSLSVPSSVIRPHLTWFTWRTNSELLSGDYCLGCWLAKFILPSNRPLLALHLCTETGCLNTCFQLFQWDGALERSTDLVTTGFTSLGKCMLHSAAVKQYRARLSVTFYNETETATNTGTSWYCFSQTDSAHGRWGNLIRVSSDNITYPDKELFEYQTNLER